MIMENKWNMKNALWMLLYAVLYVVLSFIVCVLGSIHPIFFVCYQITAGLLVTGVAAKAFDKIRAFGAACCLSLGMLITFFAMQDANLWHCLPVIVIAVLAEIIRLISKYNATGNMIAAIIMSFSTFGYYGQIWFNRDYTYKCAIEEMPVGYADTLMNCSSALTFPVVIIVGIVAAVINYNITKKLFKFDQ
ncbi:MAG: MptD family putative ECF transporter S component [Ruminococcus sp.]|nr:MptD family putative ECF transporter S component [Ruminococcus sp.]